MATEVDIVYKHFLGMINDKDWLLIDDTVIESLMRTYLDGAIGRFNICRKDLTIDYANYFIDDLDNSEIMILATGMLLQYLSPKIVCQEILSQSVTSKDYNNMPSNANLLAKLIDLKKMTKSDFDSLICDYDYKTFEGLN